MNFEQTFMSKHLLLALVCFLFNEVSSQNKDTFGFLSEAERQILTFPDDSTANAVVLYERGDNYFEVIDNRVQLIKSYHVKIRILKHSGFKEADISIPFYKGKNGSEKIMEIRAITHNDFLRESVPADKIYTININERWSENRFTFPNVKVGSVLEYRYKTISPYIYNLNGWDFQSNIPKIYSEYNAKIPGNYIYNRTLVGSLALDVNDAYIQKNCLEVPGTTTNASCEVLKYAMDNIPAFKQEEEFMLAPSNYISKIEFELSELQRFDGTKERFTKTWKDVDNEFKNDKNIGRQMTKKVFFENNVPEELLTSGDPLTRAKNIFEFTKNHFSWNGKYGIYTDIRVREAFSERQGNIGEINISMINLLNAADINTHLMLLSTRQNGLPKRNHPVMSDFNYIVAMIEIEGQIYLLDASDKLNPFGQLPIRCLNYYGRVMDFENDSYWFDIIPEANNKHIVRGQLSLDMDNDKARGVFNNHYFGYEALLKSKTLSEIRENEYVKEIENSISQDFHVTSYELQDQVKNGKMFRERLDFEISNLGNDKLIYLNPFLIKFFPKNPFTLQERNYPIDFAYRRKYEYRMNIQIPPGFVLKETPKPQQLILEDKAAIMTFKTEFIKDFVMVYFELSLNHTNMEPQSYQPLKELFSQVSTILNNTVLVFDKKE